MNQSLKAVTAPPNPDLSFPRAAESCKRRKCPSMLVSINYVVIIDAKDSESETAISTTSTMSEYESSIPPEIMHAYREAKARGLPDGWTCSIDVSKISSVTSE